MNTIQAMLDAQIVKKIDIMENLWKNLNIARQVNTMCSFLAVYLRGAIQKLGAQFKTWKRRWLIAENNNICYYPLDDVVASTKPKGTIAVGKIKEARVSQQTEKPFMFEVCYFIITLSLHRMNSL